MDKRGRKRINRTKEQIEHDIKTRSKTCARCKERKKFEEFHLQKNLVDQRRNWCKGCSAEYNKSIRHRNRRYSLKKHYGITEEEWDKIFKGCCDICGKTEGTFCVDHCHSSNEIRGILCQQCNSGLGFFQDSKANLNNAIEYLNKNGIKERIN